MFYTVILNTHQFLPLLSQRKHVSSYAGSNNWSTFYYNLIIWKTWYFEQMNSTTKGKTR